MSHIFISYSHKDSEYARALADNLQSMGFNVWIDARLDYGAQWPLEIQTRLDSCDAFIVIMTPRAFASEWVQSELQRAKRKAKPIFPFLLEGDEPWLSVESTQFYDVRGGHLPDAKFYSALRRAMPVSQTDRTLQYISSKQKVKPAEPVASEPKQKAKLSTEIIVALIGAVVTIVTACATIIGSPLIEKWVNAPAPSATVSAPPTLSLVATSQIAQVETAPATISASASDDGEAKMVLIPAGKFNMGSNQGDPDEKPIHSVDLDAYLIDVYEVSIARYFACVSAGKCQVPSNDNDTIAPDSMNANYPVILVDWDMANAYCAWRGARLPTEAEWEKAARGTDERIFPWGNVAASCQLANFGNCVPEGTAPITAYPNGVSPYGVYNMGGNVFEWVADYYASDYYSHSPLKNPTGPEVGELRVMRGGSYGYDETYMRSTVRYGQSPTLHEYSLGFRCVKDVTP